MSDGITILRDRIACMILEHALSKSGLLKTEQYERIVDNIYPLADRALAKRVPAVPLREFTVDLSRAYGVRYLRVMSDGGLEGCDDLRAQEWRPIK